MFHNIVEIGKCEISHIMFLHYIILLILWCNIGKNISRHKAWSPWVPSHQVQSMALGYLTGQDRDRRSSDSVYQESKKNVHHRNAAVFCKAFGWRNSCDDRAFCYLMGHVRQALSRRPNDSWHCWFPELFCGMGLMRSRDCLCAADVFLLPQDPLYKDITHRLITFQILLVWGFLSKDNEWEALTHSELYSLK